MFNIYNYFIKNALYYYEQALILDPNNTKAVNGITQVIDAYRQRTQSSIEQKNYSQASTNLEILIEIDPNDASIKQFKDTIIQAQNALDAIELEEKPIDSSLITN